jgi:hypothetical protein
MDPIQSRNQAAIIATGSKGKEPRLADMEVAGASTAMIPTLHRQVLTMISIRLGENIGRNIMLFHPIVLLITRSPEHGSCV